MYLAITSLAETVNIRNNATGLPGSYSLHLSSRQAWIEAWDFLKDVIECVMQ